MFQKCYHQSSKNIIYLYGTVNHYLCTLEIKGLDLGVCFFLDTGWMMLTLLGDFWKISVAWHIGTWNVCFYLSEDRMLLFVLKTGLLESVSTWMG